MTTTGPTDDTPQDHRAENAFLQFVVNPSDEAAAHTAEVAIAQLQRDHDVAVQRLRVAILTHRNLLKERNLARAWAWAEVHRYWQYSWFPEHWRPLTPQAEWRLPRWLTTPVPPDRQTWWADDESSGSTTLQPDN